MIPKLVLGLLFAGPLAVTSAGFLANSPPSTETKASALADVVCTPRSLVRDAYSADSNFAFEGNLYFQLAKGSCKHIPVGVPFARSAQEGEVITMADDTITIIESGTVGNDSRTWYHLLKVPISTD